MVRHYFLRTGSHLADIRVNLAPKKQRAQQSHTILLRIRDDLTALGGRSRGAGQTGRSAARAARAGHDHGRSLRSRRRELPGLIAAARRVEARLAREPGVVDVDLSAEAEPAAAGVRDRQAQSGPVGRIDPTIAETLQLALAGRGPPCCNNRARSSRCGSNCVCPARSARPPTTGRDLRGRRARANWFSWAPWAEFIETTEPPTIYRKNLRRVVFVYGEVAGTAAGRRHPGHAVRPAARRQRPAAGRSDPAARAAHLVSPGGGDPWSCRSATRWSGRAKANGRSRWTCSAIWASPSAPRCC
jgi:multidrug efflux pump subunit AcrB